MMQTCESMGLSVGDVVRINTHEYANDYDSGWKYGDIVTLCGDDKTHQPNFKNSNGDTRYIYLDWIEIIHNDPPKPKEGYACVWKFESSHDRDQYLEYLRDNGFGEARLQGSKGMWVTVFVKDGTHTYASFKTAYEADNVGERFNYTVTRVKYIAPVPAPVIEETKIENTAEVAEEKESEMSTENKKQLRLAKTKENQINAAKIAAKIEVGKIANTQITKRIMKAIKLPPMLVGYKKQLEPIIRLLVANGGMIAADSMGVDNEKADFILEAMQLAGTQEVLGLINLDETIDNLIGMVDPKLMARAGANDVDVDIDEDDDE